MNILEIMIAAKEYHQRPLLIEEGSPKFPLLVQEGSGVVRNAISTIAVIENFRGTHFAGR